MTDRPTEGRRTGGNRRPANALAPVFLPPSVRQQMIEHAAREWPRECCGLLVGRDRSIVAAVPTTNLAASATRFHVNEREHLRLRRSVRLLSPPLHVVGVYHSHPDGPARPSARDIAEAFYAEWVYVVIAQPAKRSGRVRGFRIEGRCARPLRLCAVAERTERPAV